MQYIWQGLNEAASIVFRGDVEVLDAAFRSVWISCLAVFLASATGLPLGSCLARRSFFGKGVVVQLFRAAMAFPTVFIGLVCYAMLSRQGPLGGLEVLYSPWAIVAGEFILAFPIIVSLSHGSIRSLDTRVYETARMLGANGFQRWTTYLSEARIGVTLAVLSAFARCVTELGIAMMVGGNLKGRTRTLSTATALETSQGEFAKGLAMGMILLFIALTITLAAGFLSRERES